MKQENREKFSKPNRFINEHPFYTGLIVSAAGLAIGAGTGKLINYYYPQSPELNASQGAYEELAPVTSPLRIVYEGQKEPKCSGDIEKVIPQKNAKGEFASLTVYCKPEAVAPAK